MSGQIINRQEKLRPDLGWLEDRLQVLLAELAIMKPRLEVTLVDDQQISELNRRYFAKNGPTNVISFPAKEDEFLGEVILSVETVRRETEPLGYSLEEGLLYYLIHGVLHLIGDEHVGVSAPVAAAMYARQENLFTKLLL